MDIGDPLKHVTVFNKDLCESLADSLGVSVSPRAEVETTYGARTKRLSAERRTRTTEDPGARSTALLGPVLKKLQESGRLRGYRPNSAGDFWRDTDLDWYVFESLTATPVYVPVRRTLPDSPVPDAIKVWVADPVEGSVEREDEWDFVGSFLFIVEELAPMESSRSWFLSGLSSLRLIAEVLASGDDLALSEGGRLTGSGSDRYGRWFDDHPVDKLRLVGGTPGRPRKIETVYKICYATDEQTAVLDGKAYRVNDLLAYPLYIAE